MKTLEEIRQELAQHQQRVINAASDGMSGVIRWKHVMLYYIASWGGGWDHVSVHCDGRCPIWDEMCFMRDIFFQDFETILQYHPSKTDYINCHPYTLHLWRPQGEAIPMPPKEMV